MGVDYYPDVEPGSTGAAPESKPPPVGKTSETFGQMRAQWEAQFPTELTFAEGVRQFDKLAQFGWTVMDRICHGTCPPASVLAPDMYKAIKDAEKIRDGLQVFAKAQGGKIANQTFTSKPDPKWNKLRSYGLAVFHQAEKLVGKAAKEDEKIKDWSPLPKMPWENNKSDWTFWKYGIMAVLGIAAVSTFTDLVRTVKGRD